MEYNLFAVLRSLVRLSEGCRTSHTNTTFVTNINIVTCTDMFDNAVLLGNNCQGSIVIINCMYLQF